MRIAIVCNDTRGGVQPYVALARGLRAAGHEVQAVAPADLVGMFEGEGARTTALAGNLEELVRASGGAVERGTVAAMRLAAKEMPARIRGWTRAALDGCEGADVITGGVGGMVVGLAAADKLGVPFVEAHLQPVGAPTDAYPGPLVASVPRWLGGWATRMSHHVSELGVWMPFRGAMDAARADLGLAGPSTAAAGQPVIYALSRHVVPVPAAPPGGRPRHVTGYWSLPAPAGWEPPAELAAFLADPGPVVSIGFGSMPNSDPAAVTELVLGAVRDAGVRAVLLAGWGGLGALPGSDDVWCADALPHDWLFPRVAAVVHHGGAGTTGAGARAGVPSVVVPFTMDQPFWGGRIAALGVGPAPVPRGQLTRARLADALRVAVTDDAMLARAATLGAAIRAEDGVGAAVAVLERV